jgi:hypothetical protein
MIITKEFAEKLLEIMEWEDAPQVTIVDVADSPSIVVFPEWKDGLYGRVRLLDSEGNERTEVR